MPFLQFGATTIPVAVGGATETAPETIGSDSRAYSGALRSTVRVEKRGWNVTTRHLTTALETTIRGLVANGAFVSVTGDMLGGATVSCRVMVTGSQWVQVAGGQRRVLQLTIKEV